jgi:hypothetical protein
MNERSLFMVQKVHHSSSIRSEIPGGLGTVKSLAFNFCVFRENVPSCRPMAGRAFNGVVSPTRLVGRACLVQTQLSPQSRTTQPLLAFPCRIGTVIKKSFWEVPNGNRDQEVVVRKTACPLLLKRGAVGDPLGHGLVSAVGLVPNCAQIVDHSGSRVTGANFAAKV